MEKKQTGNAAQGAEAKNESKTATIVELPKNLPAVQIKGLGLPQTIDAIELLHKKIMHRTRLEMYIDSLQAFEIKKEEEDLTPTNYYVGCKLDISDDGNGKFNVKHPQMIKEVIEFLKSRFTARLAEIEAEIVLPKMA